MNYNKNAKNLSINVKNIIILLFFISISAFRVNMFIALPCFVLILLFSIVYDRKIKINNILKWGIVFWSYYLISSIWSENSNDTFRYMSAVVYMIGIYIFIPKLIKNEDDINNSLNLMFWSLSFTALVSVVLTPISEFGTERMGSVLGINANIYGFRMATGGVLAFFLLVNDKLEYKKNKLNKIFLITFLVIFTLLTLLSGSKKSLVFLLVGIFLFELFRTKGYKKIIKILTISLLIIAVLYFMFNNSKLYNVIGYRFERLYLTVTGNNTTDNTDKSLIERQFYREEAKNMFKTQPIFGHGGNSFVTHIRNMGYYHVAYSHNNYLELLCTLGIVGFAIYYYYWIKIEITLLKVVVREKDVSKRQLPLILLIIISLFFVIDYWNVNYIVEFNSLFLCIADSYINVTKNKKNVGDLIEK